MVTLPKSSYLTGIKARKLTRKHRQRGRQERPVGRRPLFAQSRGGSSRGDVGTWREGDRSWPFARPVVCYRRRPWRWLGWGPLSRHLFRKPRDGGCRMLTRVDNDNSSIQTADRVNTSTTFFLSFSKLFEAPVLGLEENCLNGTPVPL